MLEGLQGGLSQCVTWNPKSLHGEGFIIMFDASHDVHGACHDVHGGFSVI